MCFKDVDLLFLGGVLRLFQSGTKCLFRVCQEFFKSVSRVYLYQACFKGVVYV